MEIFVTVTTSIDSAHVFTYEEVGVDSYVSTDTHTHYSRHFTMYHHGAFQVMSPTFPEASSISVLPSQAS